MGVSARVTLTVEIEIPDHWGDEVTAAQFLKQAEKSAMQQLRKGLILDGSYIGEESGKARATSIRPAKIDAIIVKT